MCYKFPVSFCIVLLFCVSCGKNKKTTQPETEIVEQAFQPSLELVWQTDSLLTTCESVLYDKVSKTIYVSNINQDPWEKDGNGFISTINTEGNITELKWVEGMSAPKGMGISNGKLYVNDIDDLVEIDIESRKILNKYTVEGNPRLNDITVSPEGAVYSSGTNSNTIYEFVGDALHVVAKDSLGGLNGLLWQKEALYYLDFATNNFGAFDMETKAFKTLTEEIGQGDGAVRLENGDFITSSWGGQLFYINSKDWTKTKLLDTQDQSINAADIDYIPETQMLLVPTFFHNRVMCYKVNLQ